jgi:pyrroline-5-carboxylate reductase
MKKIPLPSLQMAFIGGGNMAQAIIAGLIRSGYPANAIQVVEPVAAQRSLLESKWGLNCRAFPSEELSRTDMLVWAVKPQSFAQAATDVARLTQQAVHISVMAGISTDTLANRLQTERIIRAMPNTPAMIGQGISGLFARHSVSIAERRQAEWLLSCTGEVLWFDQEDALDAVTAISGSGPAYVFFMMEALVEAAQNLGLSAQQGLALALATFKGATALALDSTEPPQDLRQKVTSKGGTTHAAISHLESQGVRETFIQAVIVARDRARQMGKELC